MAENTNTDNMSVYMNNLSSLMKIIASLNHASDTLIGKAAKTLMYQTGKDLGRLEGKKLISTFILHGIVTVMIIFF